MKVQEQSATYLAQTISGGWCEKPLRELVTKLVDGSHNPPPKQDSGLPMLSARNIENNRIVFNEYRLISESAFKTEHARSRITAGDVLLTIVGTIGRAAVVPESATSFALQRSVAVLSPGPELLSKYLVYQLQSPTIQRYFEANARGTAQKGVYLKTLGQTPIQVAPLDQQKRIVAEIEKQFSRLDEAVANLKRVKANLKRYKAAVLKAAVEGKLTEAWRKQHPDTEPASELLQRILAERRAKWEQAELAKMQAKGKIPKDDAWKKKYPEPAGPDTTGLPELPDGWVWSTVGQLGAVKGGKRLPAGHNYSAVRTPYAYLRVTDFESFGIRASELEYLPELTRKAIERYTISSKDIYISIAGTIGLVGQVSPHLDGSNLTENAAKITDLFCTEPMYLVYWLASPKGVGYISQSTIATTQAKLALYRIEKVPVPLTPLAEQQQIAAEVGRYFSLADEAEAQVNANLQRAERLRQSVLASAFTPLAKAFAEPTLHANQEQRAAS